MARTKVDYVIMWRWRSEKTINRDEITASNADLAIRGVVKRISAEYSVKQRRDIVIMAAFRFEDDYLAYLR